MLDQPRWLELAWAELGTTESPGDGDNPRVVQYYADAGHPEVRHDSTAWCAAFVGACLARADQPNTGSLLARSYLDWGAPLTEPRLGAVAILSRGRDTSLGHVGFLVGMAGTQPLILAGNQGDAVSIAAFPPERLLGLRWPAGTSPPATPGPPSEPDQPPQSAAVFDAALTHVLAMEGGWSNDPVDPGGATNFGITIGEFAHETGVALSPDTQPQLTADLRHISPALVRSIYFKRYWQAAFCDRLPAGLALMHFDAAVNHGVGTAALLLQSALDVDPDGEIGPDTLGAARMLPTAEVIARYADLRRARYRRLATFWRFGRGWLARVDATLAAAARVDAANPSQSPPQRPRKEPLPMDSTNPDTASPDPRDGKWWAHSLTIWGTLITGLSTVLPLIAPMFGLKITPDLVHLLGDQLVAVVQAVGGLAGTIMAIVGRTRATPTLLRRSVVMTV